MSAAPPRHRSAMTPWIVLAVVLVALALGYALASTRATRLDRRRSAAAAPVERPRGRG